MCSVDNALALSLYIYIHYYDLLTQLINSCLDCGVMPSIWKVGCITAMPKGSSLKVPGDWRPVSILQFGNVWYIMNWFIIFSAITILY